MIDLADTSINAKSFDSPNIAAAESRIRSFFPYNSSLRFWISGERRKEQRRLYAEVAVGRRQYFVKSALIDNDKFYERERKSYSLGCSIRVCRPKLLIELPKTNVFEFTRGEKLSKTLYTSKAFVEQVRTLSSVIKKIALFHIFSDDYVKLNSKYRGLVEKGTLELMHIGNMHGDMSPSNIIVGRNNITIVDWEDFKSDGICELDAIHFFVMLGVLWFSGIKRSHDSLAKEILYNKRFGSFVKRLSNTYCAMTGYKRENIVELLPIYCKAQIMRLEDNHRNTADFIYPSLIDEVEGLKNDCIAWL